MDIAATNAVLRALHEGEFSFKNPILEPGRNLGIEPGGQPPPNAPSLYIAVDEAGVQVDGRPSDNDDHLDEIITISITLNRRLGNVPPDRLQQAYQINQKMLYSLERQTLQAIHGKIVVMTLANEYEEGVAGSYTGQFTTPLFYKGRSRTMIKPAEWSGETGGDVSGWAVRQLDFIGLLATTPVDQIYFTEET